MSKIEWTEKTWNPVTGCDKVSRGCLHCYAMHMSHRLAGIPASREKYTGTTRRTPGGQTQWTGLIKLHPELLQVPIRWQKPRMIFPCSMSDLFHKDVPFEFIAAVFGVMAYCKRHTFQLLTKRPERALEFFQWLEKGTVKDLDGKDLEYDSRMKCVQFAISKITNNPETILMAMTNVKGGEWPLSNVWMMTSVEDQEQANKRIPDLLKIPAAVRGLSCEPLVGPIALTNIAPDPSGYGAINCLEGYEKGFQSDIELNSKIHWVICGGESGPDAAPMHPDWVRSLRDQCAAAAVAFFLKQWGEWIPADRKHGDFDPQYQTRKAEYKRPFATMTSEGKIYTSENYKCPDYDNGDYSFYKVGKHLSGNFLDGKQHLEYPVIKTSYNHV